MYTFNWVARGGDFKCPAGFCDVPEGVLAAGLGREELHSWPDQHEEEKWEALRRWPVLLDYNRASQKLHLYT